MKIYFLALITCYFVNLNAQEWRLFVGHNLGIQKEYTTEFQNDRSYFSCYNRCWSTEKGFLSRNYYYELNAGVMTPKGNYFELSVSGREISSNIYLEIHDSYELGISDFLGYAQGGYRPNFGYGFSYGRQIDLGKKFFLVPLIKFSYTYNTGENDTLNYRIGQFEKYAYEELNIKYNDNHILLGLKVIGKYMLNEHWSINMQIGYNQGLRKDEELYQTVSIFSRGDEIDRGHFIKRLSHSYLTLGAYYSWKISE